MVLKIKLTKTRSKYTENNDEKNPSNKLTLPKVFNIKKAFPLYHTIL